MNRTAVVTLIVTEDATGVDFQGSIENPENDGWALREVVMQMTLGQGAGEIDSLSIVDLDGETQKLI